MEVDELVARVSPVICRREQEIVGRASGFFWAHEKKLFFVTNRHVVVDEESGYGPDELQLRLHTNPDDIRANAFLSVTLYDCKHRSVWLEHPTGGKQVDVVAVPLDHDEVRSRFVVRAFSNGDLVPEDIELGIGKDLLVIGYPLGYYDEIHNLPIVRNAVMASIYPVPFRGNPYCLIDSRLHSGTSGSPVITKPSTIHRRVDGSVGLFTDDSAGFLVGIHSATVDLPCARDQWDEPLGLNVVWFASLLSEIVPGSVSWA